VVWVVAGCVGHYIIASWDMVIWFMWYMDVFGEYLRKEGRTGNGAAVHVLPL